VPLLIGGLGMGAIFAPLATEAMRVVPVHLAGAASGVLNTGRQLGATLGAAVTGAVLANRLTVEMHSRAVTAADRLPATARDGFVAGFDGAARHGLLVGRGQSGIAAPAAVQGLVDDVYAHAFIAAQRPTLAVPVAVLLAGGLLCLLVRRRPSPVVDEPVPELAAANAG
jgi:hypothetical protein